MQSDGYKDKEVLVVCQVAGGGAGSRVAVVALDQVLRYLTRSLCRFIMRLNKKGRVQRQKNTYQNVLV